MFSYFSPPKSITKMVLTTYASNTNVVDASEILHEFDVEVHIFEDIPGNSASLRRFWEG